MLKTLIVDDSTTFRKTFRSALYERFPFMLIEEAPGATEALQKIKTFLPDLIFMDISLPGENGLELTRRIKASHPEIAIIILTASGASPGFRNWRYAFPSAITSIHSI